MLLKKLGFEKTIKTEKYEVTLLDKFGWRELLPFIEAVEGRRIVAYISELIKTFVINLKFDTQDRVTAVFDKEKMLDVIFEPDETSKEDLDHITKVLIDIVTKSIEYGESSRKTDNGSI